MTTITVLSNVDDDDYMTDVGDAVYDLPVTISNRLQFLLQDQRPSSVHQGLQLDSGRQLPGAHHHFLPGKAPRLSSRSQHEHAACLGRRGM